METILIVDDEKNYPPILSAVLEEEGFETLTSNSGKEALQIFDSADVDLVLTDMKMPEMSGIELLEKIKERNPDIPVIMMTAHGTVEKAVEAMQKDAYTYILKPFDNDRMIMHVKKAIAMYRVVKENRRLRVAVESQYSFGNIIGKSKNQVRQVFIPQKIVKQSPKQYWKFWHRAFFLFSKSAPAINNCITVKSLFYCQISSVSSNQNQIRRKR